MKRILLIICIFSSFLMFSCRGNNKTQSNISNTFDDSKQFALTLYGDEVKILAAGDLLLNNRQSAIAGVVRKQINNTFWIQKGSFIQKENEKWQVLLKMEKKLSSLKGELVNQVDADNGYLISFDTTNKPIQISIVMANENGEEASDEAVIKWNSSKNDFEFVAPYEDIPQ